MSILAEDKAKIAVFIDFDNIEIGVRTTLSRRFDIGTILEAIRERGEVVTKVAYGNWQRAENFSREMAEHAVQMVQRNLTPGGDKNGADIHLALDALEMAFTRDHINTFVIVGGDSDFIALVEKLKQYDKRVYIVGGRAFTSVILQKNCHEFIAYENLAGIQPTARRFAGKSASVNRLHLESAMPLIRRALKILADREVSAQLGLLKSTLLQLDSTFSERDYGAGSFQEFIQKLAGTGFVAVKQVDRSLIVEMKETESQPAEAPPAPPEAVESEASSRSAEPAVPAETIGALKEMFINAAVKPRWPLYMRGLKQFLRAADPSFNEQRYGFATLHDLARQLQREGVVRMERSRDGILRIFPTDRLAAELSSKAQAAPPPPPAEEPVQSVPIPEAEAAPPAELSPLETPVEVSPEVTIPVEEIPHAESTLEPPVEEKPRKRRRTNVPTEPRRRVATRAGGARARKTRRLETDEG